MEVGGAEIGEINPVDLQFGLFLDRPGFINYALPVGHRLANIRYTNPYNTDFMYIRDGVKMLAGLHTELGADETGSTFQVSGQDWKHYFEKRFWPLDPAQPQLALYAVVQEDTFTVVDHILDTVLAQPKSPAFTYNIGTSGNKTNYRIEPADSESIYDKISGLSDEAPGFDWIITPDKAIQLFGPAKGNKIPYVLEKHKNVVDMTVANQGVQASHVIGLGAGSQNRLAVVGFNPTIARRYDAVEDFGEVIDLAALGRLTNREVLKQSTISLQLTVRLKKDSADDFWKNVTLGDTVRTVGDVQGYMYVDEDFRIVGIEGDVSASGDENLTLSVELAGLV